MTFLVEIQLKSNISSTPKEDRTEVLKEEEVKPATEGTGIPCKAKPTNLPSTTTLPQPRSTDTINTKIIWAILRIFR